MAETACVLAPDPLLTVTVEATLDGEDEIHLHAGGQGFWVGRMVDALGVPVTLCGPFGGESGRVVRAIIEEQPLSVRAVESAGSNGTYIHDRRQGERVSVAQTPPTPCPATRSTSSTGLRWWRGWSRACPSSAARGRGRHR
jgi:1-phosphofructokinase